MNADAGVTGVPPSYSWTSTMTSVGQDIYIFGDVDGLFKYSTVWLTWTKWDRLAGVSGRSPIDYSHIPLQAYKMTTVGQDIYIFLGISCVDSSSCESTVTSDLFKFSTILRRWTKVAVTGTVPSARSGHSVTGVGHDIYIYGGKSNSGELDDMTILKIVSDDHGGHVVLLLVQRQTRWILYVGFSHEGGGDGPWMASAEVSDLAI